jgi:hypothetical protein
MDIGKTQVLLTMKAKSIGLKRKHVHHLGSDSGSWIPGGRTAGNRESQGNRNMIFGLLWIVVGLTMILIITQQIRSWQLFSVLCNLQKA